jgi:hypothetical protein
MLGARDCACHTGPICGGSAAVSRLGAMEPGTLWGAESAPARLGSRCFAGPYSQFRSVIGAGLQIVASRPAAAPRRRARDGPAIGSVELEVACPRAALGVDDETARVVAKPLEVAHVVVKKDEHLRRHWTESVCHAEVGFASSRILHPSRRTSPLRPDGHGAANKEARIERDSPRSGVRAPDRGSALGRLTDTYRPP